MSRDDQARKQGYKNSPAYLKLIRTPVSGLSATDIYTAFQAIPYLGDDENFEYMKFLKDLRDLLAMASTGQETITETNSALNLLSNQITSRYAQNTTDLARLRDVEYDITATGTALPAERVEIAVTLGAGGTLAATQLVPAVADTGYYVEKLELKMDPSSANLAATGGHGAVVFIQDDAGTPVVMMTGVITNANTCCNGTYGGIGGDNQDMDIKVDAGTAGNVGAAKLYGSVIYRGI